VPGETPQSPESAEPVSAATTPNDSPAAPTHPAAPGPVTEEAQDLATEERHSPVRFWLKVAALLFAIGYSVAFVVGNAKSIKVDFVFGTARVTLIWTVLLLLVIGFVGGVLGSHLYRHRRRKQSRKP
jgi:uncharacterized integral membrane protein